MKNKIPLTLKLIFTVFMAVLVPCYYLHYGPANFLYFCDASLFLTLITLWTEKPLCVCMAAVGILVPQFFWCIDFLIELIGFHATGMTHYMLDTKLPLYLRALSLFHGWLPFLLCYLVYKLGYDKRALVAWSVFAIALCLTSYYFLPPAGAVLANTAYPRNVDYVFGLDDAHPQMRMPQALYLWAWLAALFVFAYLPVHVTLKKLVPIKSD